MSEAQATVELSPKAQDFYHGLWASLFYTPQTPPASVLVCTPNRREGATTVACGLALAGTAPDERSRVVLVEFNLRHPKVAEQLGVPAAPGVLDVLTGQMPLGEAVHRVGPGQLDVLPAGGQSGRLLEVLRADRVRKFLSDLQSRYDHVIVDVAPANPYPDAQVLAELVAGVVLVAHCGVTSREALAQARKRLETGAGKVLGVVLNMRTYPIPRFLYRRV